jgi:hypothetical protein
MKGSIGLRISDQPKIVSKFMVAKKISEKHGVYIFV